MWTYKADSSIVESSIGEIPVTIGGEVDCVDGELSCSWFS